MAPAWAASSSIAPARRMPAPAGRSGVIRFNPAALFPFYKRFFATLPVRLLLSCRLAIVSPVARWLAMSRERGRLRLHLLSRSRKNQPNKKKKGRRVMQPAVGGAGGGRGAGAGRGRRGAAGRRRAGGRRGR